MLIFAFTSLKGLKIMPFPSPRLPFKEGEASFSESEKVGIGHILSEEPGPQELTPGKSAKKEGPHCPRRQVHGPGKY